MDKKNRKYGSVTRTNVTSGVTCVDIWPAPNLRCLLSGAKCYPFSWWYASPRSFFPELEKERGFSPLTFPLLPCLSLPFPIQGGEGRISGGK